MLSKMAAIPNMHDEGIVQTLYFHVAFHSQLGLCLGD